MVSTNYYWKWNQVIPKEICDVMLQSVDWANCKEGAIGVNDGQCKVDKATRETDLVWVDDMSTVGCVLQTYALTANASAGWNFVLNGIEQVQIGRYNKKGHYDWHRDLGSPDSSGRQRKLSVVLMLSDTSDYEGGVLEIEGLDTPLDKLKQGDVIVFPAYVRHRVTEVTEGTRYSAVGWCSGPAFR